MALKRKDKIGAGCLSLFALPFAGVGVAAIYYIGSMLWAWQRMANWVPVPTQIVRLDLESHQDEDSTTHKVVAHYRYAFDRQRYEGDRVAISSMADNIGDFQETLYRQLQNAEARGSALALRGMQAGNKLYYDLRVETHNRRNRTAATSIPDFSVAHWLAEHWMGQREPAAGAAGLLSEARSSRSRRRAAG